MSAALQELLQGVIGSLQEEEEEKLGQPLARRNPQTLESADSANIQSDLMANIAGARQVLLDTGLLELIRSRDAALAQIGQLHATAGLAERSAKLFA